MINALAWDDEPNAYIQDLAEYLAEPEIGIKLTIVETRDEFIRELNRGGWTFVVTDLMRGPRIPGTGEEIPIGAELARNAIDRVGAVFIVTQHYNRVDPGDNPYGISPQVLIKSKSTHPGWLAGQIRDDLRRRGLYLHSKKVFLVYGHDRLSNDAHQEVETFLTEHGVEVQIVRPDNLFGDIASGLMERMNDCAAFVAVCTPDDKVESDGKTLYQPRQNVLFEMGMAMGLNRGLKRLVILQRWGKSVEEQAFLPSNLGGVVPIRFERLDDAVIEALRSKLLELQVDLSPPATPSKSSKKSSNIISPRSRPKK